MSIADAKSASFIRVQSLTKIQARNFSLLDFPKWFYLINGQFNIASLSLIFKNDQFFPLSLSQKFPPQGIQGLGTSKGHQFENMLQNTLLLHCFWSHFITAVTFSVLVHQMCALNTKQLNFAYSFSFGETSYKHLKVTCAAWRSWDVLRLSI